MLECMNIRICVYLVNLSLSRSLGGAAAVLPQIRDQLIHRGGMGGVIQEPAFLADVEQAGVIEFLEMKGQGGRRDAELRPQLAGGHTLVSHLDQAEENGHARVMA